MKVILASGSPRRRELMEMLGIRCKVQASGAEEVVTSAEPEKVVEELSRLKCLDVAEITEGDAVVIGAGAGLSTSAGLTYSGPRFQEHFGDFIQKYKIQDMYSGGFYPFDSLEEHQVYTGVTIAVTEGDAKRVVSFCDRTDVEFYAMTEEEINGYLALEKEGEAPVWSDKAGGYGIQTVFGTKFVKGIQGDYYNVMGLPASRVYHELKNLGVLE